MLTDFEEITGRLNSYNDWCRAWSERAAHHEQLGREALTARHFLTAGECLQRAGVYYHFASFLFAHDPVQMKAAHKKQIECRQLALPHLSPPGERVEIPYLGKTLAGILRKPAGVARPPVVVMAVGLDSTKEETDAYEIPFLARGMATLVFEGPGQGEAQYDLPIRGDWEVPAAAIADAVAGLPGIDAGRVGVWGVSLGGYYAARAASGEPRLRACVSLCGPYCLGDTWDRLPELSRAAFRVRSKSGSDAAARRAAAQLSMAGRAARLARPLLIIMGKRDRMFPWQDAQRLHDEAGPAAEMMLLEDGNHGCANVTYRHRPYAADWMARQLGG